MRLKPSSLLFLWIAVPALVLGFGSWPARAADAVSYAEDVYPVLEFRCLSCHRPGGAGYETSGLDLRTYDGLMKGTKFGAMVVPRDAGASNLLTVIDHRTDPKIWMPHQAKRMSKCERLLIRAWISQGARDN